jgi:intracellular multiplication protein IcmP
MSKSQHGPEMDPAIVLGLVACFGAAIGFALWHFGHAQLAAAYAYLKVGEMDAIGLFTDRLMTLNAWMRDVPKDDLEFQQLVYVAHATGSYLRFPAALLLFAMTAVVYFNASSEKTMRRKFTLDRLIDFQAEEWGNIAPFTKINPIKIDEKNARIAEANAKAIEEARNLADDTQTPPQGTAFVPQSLDHRWDPSLSPPEWVDRYGMDGTNNYADAVAKRSFEKQLSSAWEGPLKLPPYCRVLLAAFSLKAARKREEAHRFLGRAAKSFADHDKMGDAIVEEADRIIASKSGREIVKIAERHAYMTTALLGALDWARQRGGVMAWAEFNWIKAVDRPLSYALNNLGRRSFHIEGAGAMAHFAAEKLAGRPLTEPCVAEAFTAMKVWMDEAYKGRGYRTGEDGR